jgi:hypothetical protein
MWDSEAAVTCQHDRPEGNAGHQTFEIRVQGHLPPDWSDWFAGLTVTHDPGGITILQGSLPDQAALHGVLTRIRDLGIPLVEVRKSNSGDDPA